MISACLHGRRFVWKGGIEVHVLFRCESCGALNAFRESVSDGRNCQRCKSVLIRPIDKGRLSQLREKYSAGGHCIVATYRKDGEENGDIIPLPDLTGKACMVGIGYAAPNDFASVNLHFLEDGIRYDINHSWLCLQSKDLPRIKAPWRQWVKQGYLTFVDDKEINPDLLAGWIAHKAQLYKIKKIAVDSFHYGLLKHSLSNIGFDVDKNKNIVLLRQKDIARTVKIISEVFANHQFRWGDNPVLRWVVGNTNKVRCHSLLQSNNGNYIYAKIAGEERKIDPWMALVYSMTIENELL